MAIETDSFKRGDLYTLFITTRILNFLKGLPLANQSTFLSDALHQAKSLDKRSAIGAELFEILLEQHCLYAQTPQGRKPRQHFKPELFFEVWNQLGKIKTQTGQEILI